MKGVDRSIEEIIFFWVIGIKYIDDLDNDFSDNSASFFKISGARKLSLLFPIQDADGEKIVFFGVYG